MNRTILTLALCLSCASVGAQNLVVNGDFDTDLSGWLIDPLVTQPTWTNFDIGSAASGSARLSNSSTTEFDRIYPLEQCIALTQAGRYGIVAHGFIPPGQAGGKLVVSYWLSLNNPDCPVFQGVQASGGQFITTIGAWERFEQWLSVEVPDPVPANARIKISLGIEKDNAGGILYGYFDAISVVADAVFASGFD